MKDIILERGIDNRGAKYRIVIKKEKHHCFVYAQFWSESWDEWETFSRKELPLTFAQCGKLGKYKED